ncbi:hypothetical protein F5Y16DRAFT_361881 [Xylariaceae sp. FL0255]|nr:hypothetical protein F5Y16DRAFT_361881 [Xylariaceae sp. FL0255]
MPLPLAAKAGVIAVSVAVAAAIAIYEIPEVQRMASDLRRRIALYLHAFGDSISPQERENLFNRPEDAEGFLTSRGLGPGVDADPETLRRQREELMYWNAIRESMREEEERKEAGRAATRPRTGTRGSSFDDFLQQDESAEKGTYVFHQTSRDSQQNSDGLRRRGADTSGLRGLNHSIYTNPFADEHGIEDDMAFENSLMEPEKDEIMSDIYSATDLGAYEPPRGIIHKQASTPSAIPTLVEVDESTIEKSQSADVVCQSPLPEASSESDELAPFEYMTAGAEPATEEEHNAYTSIQAWAEGASRTAGTTHQFYSPLPVTPAAASITSDPSSVSEAEVISAGQLTPTDSASLIGSGEDVGEEARSTRSFEVMSVDDGMMTPASWTEVGSVVSESEDGRAQHV